MIADLALVVGIYCTWRVAGALGAELQTVPYLLRVAGLAALVVVLGILTIDIALAGSGWAQSELGQ